MKQYIKYLLIILVNLCLVALFSACRDDIILGDGNDVPEGEPATISVTLVIPEMSPVTRSAGIDPESSEARTVTDIWVGIYNIATGKRVGQKYISSNEMQDIYNDHPNDYGTITINNITTYSGKNRIVAVANGGSSAVNVLTGNQSNSIMEMLTGKDGDTWDSFLQIAGSLSEPDVLMRGSASSFIMCGAYRMRDEVNHDNEDLLEEVDIHPNTNQTYGWRVHLRRLDSYFKFNISTEKNITFTPVSWQVCNLPGISYLFEHTPELIKLDYSLNAADYPVENINLWGITEKSFYHNSQVNGPAEFSESRDAQNNQTIYSFDFYQFENKHTGIIKPDNNVTDYYQEREKEWKFVDEDSKYLTNSGWYKSLVNENEIEESTPSTGKGRNNNASYVVIKGHVEYFYDINDPFKPVEPPQDPENPEYVKRVADVTYTIHMGYCEGTDLAKANDFNVRRNTKYTYNITIKGVDKIILEAQKDDELQPGAEGIVTDLVNNQIKLDSHYHVVNIQLTDRERAELTWRIQAPFDNEVVDLVGGAPIESFRNIKSVIDMTRVDKNEYGDYNNGRYHEALPENQFYNWIQIRPTSGEKIIADYPGDPRLIGRKIRNDDPQTPGQYYNTRNIEPYVGQGTVTVNDGNFAAQQKEDQGKGVWYLENLTNPYKYKWDGTVVPDDEIKYNVELDNSVKRWYTFFIDEYAYEYELNKSHNSLTESYPDQDDGTGTGFMQSGVMDISKWRTFVNNESRRLWLSISDMSISPDKESIYSNSQYYLSQESIQTYYGSLAKEGIGLEHTNESYKGTDYDAWSFSDYRRSPDGNHYYDLLDGLYNQYAYVRFRDERGQVTWNEILKKNSGGITYREGASHDRGTQIDNVTYYIPDHPDDFMAACLSRNRDLNNDNIIGANEIRWYLPTVATYTRMILGTSSLRSPLFNMQQYAPNFINAGTGTPYSHYASSDKSQLWAEELAATGNLNLTGSTAAKTLRCIRNIGQPTNLSPHDDDDGYNVINAAYKRRDELTGNPNDDHIIDLIFFKDEAQRPYQSGAIPSHDVASILSHAPASFKFAKEDCNNTNTNGVLARDDNKTVFFRANNVNGIEYDEIFGATGKDEDNDNDPYRLAWKQIVDANSLCRQYSEENGADRGTWRTPNISEMAILVFLNSQYNYELLGNTLPQSKVSNGTIVIEYPSKRYLTCSREYFNGKGHRFMKAGTDETITASEKGAIHFVRCVKDVR